MNVETLSKLQKKKKEENRCCKSSMACILLSAKLMEASLLIRLLVEYDKPSCLTDLQQFLTTSTVDAIHKADTLLGL